MAIDKSLYRWFAPAPAATLAFFRICFGGLMLFSTLRFILNGWIEDFYIEPEFHFTYYGFEWLPFPPGALIYLMFGGMILFSTLIMTGLFYRVSAIGFFTLFTYVELLEKSTYLNHYYFVSLISFLLIFVPANRIFSLDAYFGFCKKSDFVQAWHIGIFKFQIAVVYIFAGIAKIGSDWLINAQPLKTWLHSAHHWPVAGPLLKSDWLAYAFSWTGCLFDLFIVFFLLCSKTRNFAYAVVVIFHLLTWMLFPIGVFPWVMILSTTIFLSSHLHKNILSTIIPKFNIPAVRNESRCTNHSNVSKLAVVLLSCYIAVQVLVPLRGFLYSGDMFWTESGFRFSWRVMLMEKAGTTFFYLHDGETGKEIEIDPKRHLTVLQEKQMSYQPDMILQFSQYLAKKYDDTTLVTGNSSMTFHDPEIRAEVFVTLNGRPSQLYVDRDINLAAMPNDLHARSWLEPFNP